MEILTFPLDRHLVLDEEPFEMMKKHPVKRRALWKDRLLALHKNYRLDAYRLANRIGDITVRQCKQNKLLDVSYAPHIGLQVAVYPYVYNRQGPKMV